MSPESDRVAVPTNGHRPHPVAETVPGAKAPTDEEMSVAFTPKQLAVGFGIIASLVLLVVGLVRRRPSD
jgi:hypothetical protein